MAKWDIPNGVLGYEKSGGSGHRNKGAEVEFWGVEGREMGFIGLVTRPKLYKKEKRTILFAILRAWKTVS